MSVCGAALGFPPERGQRQAPAVRRRGPVARAGRFTCNVWLKGARESVSREGAPGAGGAVAGRRRVDGLRGTAPAGHALFHVKRIRRRAQTRPPGPAGDAEGVRTRYPGARVATQEPSEGQLGVAAARCAGRHGLRWRSASPRRRARGMRNQEQLPERARAARPGPPRAVSRETEATDAAPRVLLKALSWRDGDPLPARAGLQSARKLPGSCAGHAEAVHGRKSPPPESRAETVSARPPWE